jgi:sialidase-1
MKIALVFLCFICLLFPSHGQNLAIPLFEAGKDGYSSYRIPSIIQTSRGSLLAFCEARKDGTGDAGNIDVVMKRSVDGGKTWSKQIVIWDDGNNTCGNPTPVFDEETGTVWLLLTHNIGSDHEKDIIHKTSKGTRTVWLTASFNDGLSWSYPKEITASTKKPSWGWYATGPGAGIQIKNGPRKGRLVIPCDFSYEDANGKVANGPYEYGSHIIYSDDHGRTWQIGGTITPKMNECQVVELADGNGTLLMNMRSYKGEGQRAQSVSYDGGISWTAPKSVPDLVDPVCQASFIRYSWNDKNQKSTILFMNPASPSIRHNMAIRASFDEGKTWPIIRTLWPGPSAYSSMVKLSDGNIGLFYEAGTKSPYETIRFEVLNSSILSEK